MPKIARPLSAKAVSYLKTTRGAGVYPVGGIGAEGLQLQVTATGAQSWLLRARIDGKRRELGLGSYPLVSLEEARNKAREARAVIATGQDPARLREEALAKARNERLVRDQFTFRQAAVDYIERHRAGWKNAKHAAQWSTTLEQYAFPVIGDRVVWDITTLDMLRVLEPIWTTKTETASRVRNRIELVIASAMTRAGRSGDNPARWRGNLQTLLPAPAKVALSDHHDALPIRDTPAFMVRLRSTAGMAARALEFAILTATRTNEVLGVTWEEIDLDAGTWVIPAVRMKAAREHRVPLSDDAVACLRGVLPAKEVNTFGVIFPGRNGKPLSNMAMLTVLRRMKVEATVHGFRSTFRDWVGEHTEFPREVAEAALAHRIADGTESAYARGDLFEKRRRMMAAWAGFLGSTRGGADPQKP